MMTKVSIEPAENVRKKGRERNEGRQMEKKVHQLLLHCTALCVYIKSFKRG